MSALRIYPIKIGRSTGGRTQKINQKKHLPNKRRKKWIPQGKRYRREPLV